MLSKVREPAAMFFRPDEWQTNSYNGLTDITIAVETTLAGRNAQGFKEMIHKEEVIKSFNGGPARFNMHVELKTGILEMSHHVKNLETSQRYNNMNEIGKIVVTSV